MRIVLQRVSNASVNVDGKIVGQIGHGVCLLVGIAPSDGDPDVDAAVDKIVNLRIFRDHDGKMNLSVLDVGGEVLVVSQFTLLGDVRKGRRPSFTGAAEPELAKRLVDSMVGRFRAQGIATAEGVFGAQMKAQLVNDGPVTLVLDVEQGTVS